MESPRACGKYHKIAQALYEIVGSPPRMREILGVHIGKCWCYGITPARAGNTKRRATWCKMHRDHPRVCGKNANATTLKDIYEGSPPRVREKRYILVIHIIIFGITPAYAGKTGHAHDVTRKAWDHPRVCGKNKNPCNPQEYHLGSPPRVREKRAA